MGLLISQLHHLVVHILTDAAAVLLFVLADVVRCFREALDDARAMFLEKRAGLKSGEFLKLLKITQIKLKKLLILFFLKFSEKNIFQNLNPYLHSFNERAFMFKTSFIRFANGKFKSNLNNFKN